MSHTPGAVFQARLLDNQKGANTERYVFGELSSIYSNADLFGTDAIPTVDISTVKSAQGCVMYTVVCGSWLVLLSGFSSFQNLLFCFETATAYCLLNAKYTIIILVIRQCVVWYVIPKFWFATVSCSVHLIVMVKFSSARSHVLTAGTVGTNKTTRNGSSHSSQPCRISRQWGFIPWKKWTEAEHCCGSRVFRTYKKWFTLYVQQ